jgi:hypothetical protein
MYFLDTYKHIYVLNVSGHKLKCEFNLLMKQILSFFFKFKLSYVYRCSRRARRIDLKLTCVVTANTVVRMRDSELNNKHISVSSLFKISLLNESYNLKSLS